MSVFKQSVMQFVYGGRVMSFLSSMVAAVLLGMVFSLFLCALIGGCYAIFLFLRDMFRRRRR